jgi:DNA primase
MDIRSTQGKTEAINKLLPIIAGVTSATRQYQYLTKLGIATGIEEKRLEASLGRFKVDRKARETRPQAIQRATRTIRSNPVEEYILAILLQHPEIRDRSAELIGEYFENSENRVIFDKWQTANEQEILTGSLEYVIQEHYNSLVTRQLPGDEVEQRFADCLLRLRERYLRNLKRKQEEALALEAESGDRDAVMAKLKEQGTRIDEELVKIFNLRAKTQGKEINEKR